VSSDENGVLLEKIDRLEDIVIDLTGALVSVRLAVNVIAIHPGVLSRMDAQQEVHKTLEESVDRVNKVLDSLKEMLRSRERDAIK
jgi:hypothetical protein